WLPDHGKDWIVRRDFGSEHCDQDQREDDDHPDDRRAIAKEILQRLKPQAGREGLLLRLWLADFGGNVNACHDNPQLTQTDSGIEITIQEVYHKIDNHKCNSDQQGEALYQSVIACGDTIHQRASNTSQSEDSFGEHRAADEQTEIQADDRDDREKRVAN